jgi:hypothetical protein
MINLRMQEMLDKGEALDVNVVGKKHPQIRNVWILPEVVNGKDYCDAIDECWIWSIGRHRETGEILASRDGRYNGNRVYECVWAR